MDIAAPIDIISAAGRQEPSGGRTFRRQNFQGGGRACGSQPVQLEIGREMGRYALDAYTETKGVFVNLEPR